MLRYVAAGLLLASRIAAAQVDLNVTAADGATLRATHYPAGKPGPAVLLLHQCNMDRKSWSGFATALMQSGIHALAFDYRGYGESPGASGRGNLEPDIDAALVTLGAQAGVDKQRIAVAGASCGVNNAVQLARRNTQVKALVLLSGPTTPDGLEYLRGHPDTPIFAASSSSEAYAVNALRAVTATSTHRSTAMRVVEKPGHGTPLFSAEPELLSSVVAWLNAVLR